MNLARLVFRLLLGRRLPIVNGEVLAPALGAEVLIRRDSFGIPHIEAGDDADAWYALGFCQGQDRAFQLEGLLRVVRGTLAKIAGSDSLPVDRLSRRIGLRASAEVQMSVLDGDVRSVLEAFARGVTDGAVLGVRCKAHAFSLLRAAPTAPRR